jgi:UDP-2-acetamido-3-amino-2,3-dideoxy-glucuronate N-acetyltransferase
VIGDRVRVQNHVSVFDGVSLEDDVFVGPGVVFTNVKRPRSEFPVKPSYQRILVERGATLGANSTILCGVRLGRYCLVGAGAVVTRDAPAFARLLGAPARVDGWVSRRGCELEFDSEGWASCPEGGELYRLEQGSVTLAE